MARSYQRLEELDEKAQPADKRVTTGKAEGTDKSPALVLLAVIALLVVALGGTLFYAARMKESADAMKTLAENTRKDTVVIHQQVKALEGERDTLRTRVDTLTEQLKKTEDEKTRLLHEVENLKKARLAPQKQDTKKSRKRA